MRALLFLTLAANLSSAFAQVVDLGAAAPFAVLGFASVINTGPTIVTGDLGTSGTAIVGFPPGVCTGDEVVGGQAVAAAADAESAYTAIASLPGVVLTGNLGGRVLGPGVYRFASSAVLVGVLTLAGTGSSCDSWIFQVGSTLSTSVGSAVVVTQGSAGNVFWRVAASATLQTGTQFSGNILAAASIILQPGVSVEGGLYALAGSVTLNDNIVGIPANSCVASPTSSSSTSSTETSTSSTSSSSSTSTDTTTTTTTTTDSSTCSSTSTEPTTTTSDSSTSSSSSTEATTTTTSKDTTTFTSDSSTSSTTTDTSTSSSTEATTTSGSSTSSTPTSDSSTSTTSSDVSTTTECSTSSSTEATTTTSDSSTSSCSSTEASTSSDSSTSSSTEASTTSSDTSTSSDVSTTTDSSTASSSSTDISTSSGSSTSSCSSTEASITSDSSTSSSTESSVSSTSSSSSIETSVSSGSSTSSSISTEASTSSSSSSIEGSTTSTVYATSIYTITKCPATVTNCPLGSTTTELISLYTTVCPVTASSTEQPPSGYTISTVFSTTIYTITKCLETITNCPVGSVTTEVISLYTTTCPITQSVLNTMLRPQSSIPARPASTQLSAVVSPSEASSAAGEASISIASPAVQPTGVPVGVSAPGAALSEATTLIPTESNVVVGVSGTSQPPAAYTGQAASGSVKNWGISTSVLLLAIGALIL